MALSTKNVQQVKNSKHQMFIFSSFHYYLTFSIIIWFVRWKNKMTNYNHKMFSWSWCSYMGKGHLLIILIYPNIVDPWTTQELGALILCTVENTCVISDSQNLTIVPLCPWGIGSRTQKMPKFKNAQVPYIK